MGSDKFVVAEGNMAVAVIDGCEKLNLRGENYKFLLLCFRCGEMVDISKTAEALSVELN